MHGKGHFGLTLLVLSIAAIPIGLGPDNVMVAIILFASALSGLPDIDLKLGIKHRGFTHNILFAILVGLGFGALFGYASGWLYGVVGFISGFGAIMTHLLGDVMTFHKFKPFYPFDSREIAYGFFPANSEKANKGFFTARLIMFFIYLFVASGGLSNFF